jgi:hypothetical protein
MNSVGTVRTQGKAAHAEAAGGVGASQQGEGCRLT